MFPPDTTLLPVWLGMGLVLAILSGLIAGLRLYQKQYSPHPEFVRKLLHIGMGLVTLLFPWLFNSVQPVILLAVLSIGLLLGIKYFKPLNQQLGNVTQGVSRESWGEIYFPISVALVFTLANRNPILFCIPILILTLADAVAALIGVRYGLMHYTTSEGEKSAEGSIAFFTVAFLSIHIPLLLLTSTGRSETLLISLMLGLLVMLLEAIAWRGLDNLFIPLGGFILLKTFLEMDVNALAWRLVFTLALVLFCIGWRNHTTLNDSAVLGTAFVGYLSWTIGDWEWFIPPLMLFLCYSLFCPWTKQYKQRRHDMRAVLSVASTGILWICLARLLHNSDLFYLYSLGYAAHLTLIDLAIPQEHPQLLKPGFVAIAIFKGWSLILLPFLIIEGFTPIAISLTLSALVGVSLMAIAFCTLQSSLKRWENHNLLWFSRASLVTVGSTLGLIPLSLTSL